MACKAIRVFSYPCIQKYFRYELHRSGTKRMRISTPTGINGFIQSTSALASQFPLTPEGTRRFVLAFGEEMAYIRVQDAWNPWRFLRQMEGNPPTRWGTQDFKRWLPGWMALLVLWLWEFAGYVRYGFKWSQADTRSGYVGLWHGRLVRRSGHTILPSLIARDLAESGQGWSRLSQNGEKAVRDVKRKT